MNLLGLQYIFARTQWWKPERLHGHQFRQVELLLAHAVETVPYCRDRAATSGSTGVPAVAQQTELTQTIFRATTLRETLWHQREGRITS